VNATDGRPHHAFIALGSNIDPQRHLPLAVGSLSRIGEIAAASAVYESPPADGSDQPNYLNAAVLLLTDFSAEQLCTVSLPAIEAKLGRVRDPADRNAPRTIDLDLALYDVDELTIGHRRIPDPEIADRAFLAIPLAELRGDWPVPPTGQVLDQLAAPHRACQSLILRSDVDL
jgi:2-amino-4-hydroxy-6-hydroxymethyldihydropteridine diphosphokinase